MPGYWHGLICLILMFLCEAIDGDPGNYYWDTHGVIGLQPSIAKTRGNTATHDKECLLGWYWSDLYGECVPYCTQGCQDGFCKEPDKCACNAPFILKDNNSCVEIPLNSKCGDSLESCQCMDGFRMNNDKCAPVCSSVCINGYCDLPDKCACNDGYVKHSTDPNICVAPIDFKHDAKCTLGGECHCYCAMNATIQGLELLPMSKYFKLMLPCPKDVCKPKCTHECVNGTCVGPDVCECEPPLQRICIEIEPKNKVYDNMWWLVCCVVCVLVVTAISFLWCMHKRKNYAK